MPFLANVGRLLSRQSINSLSIFSAFLVLNDRSAETSGFRVPPKEISVLAVNEPPVWPPWNLIRLLGASGDGHRSERPDLGNGLLQLYKALLGGERAFILRLSGLKSSRNKPPDVSENNDGY